MKAPITKYRIYNIYYKNITWRITYYNILFYMKPDIFNKLLAYAIGLTSG